MKRALVTGATRGIGKAIAKRLVADGYDCTITGTSSARPPELQNNISYFSANFETTPLPRFSEAL